MRRPGIEPGSEHWQCPILTIKPSARGWLYMKRSI